MLVHPHDDDDRVSVLHARSALMTPSYVTDIVVDHSPDARVAVNVRIDFPRCECRLLGRGGRPGLAVEREEHQRGEHL